MKVYDEYISVIYVTPHVLCLPVAHTFYLCASIGMLHRIGNLGIIDVSICGMNYRDHYTATSIQQPNDGVHMVPINYTVSNR